MKIVHLDHFTLIHVFGKEAESFLQGQFTNDLRQLVEGSSQLSGYCTPKGRLLATFWVLKQNIESYFLFIPTTLQEKFQKRLQMYILRAQVKLNALTSTKCVGILDVDNTNPFIQKWQKEGVLFPLTSYQSVALLDTLPPLTGEKNDWDRCSIEQGYATVLPETQEEFVPQMLNFDLNHGVSFQKGCYPGQEIVARTRYLGKIKRRLYVLKSLHPLKVGMSLYTSDIPDQASGMIVNIAQDGTTYLALAVLHVSSFEKTDVTIEAEQNSGHFLERIAPQETFNSHQI